jgi:hypothetical protein
MFDRSPEARQRTIERHRQRSLKRSAQIAEFALFADESIFTDMQEIGFTPPAPEKE